MPRQNRRLAWAFAGVAFVVFNLNFRTIAAGDTVPARLLPFALWSQGSLYLDGLREVAFQGRPERPFWLRRAGDARDHWASSYPVVTPLLAAPLYLPAVAYLNRAGWTNDRVDRLSQVMEKAAASAVASLAVGWMALLLLRRFDRSTAWLLTLAFAFGTNTWVVASQALWQHGTAEVLVIATLWCFTSQPETGRALAAGLAIGLLVANRPPDLPLALGLFLCGFTWAERRAPLFTAAAALPVAGHLLYNQLVFGTFGGGYTKVASWELFTNPMPQGLAGLLVSPTRGLLVFSPLFLFLTLAFRRGVSNPEERRLSLSLLLTVLLQILFYSVTDWRAGTSWGYRFLTDAVPILVWLLAPVVAALGRPARLAFAAALLFSVWVQAVGAFRYAGESDRRIFAGPDPRDFGAAWRPANAPFLVEAREPPAEMTLFRILREEAATRRVAPPQ